MFKKRDSGALFAITIASLAVLSFHSYIGSMSRFIADDYCVAYYAQHFGFLRSIWYWYISWSGTFSTSIVDWLLVIIKTGGIPYVTPVVLIIWVAVTAAAIYLYLPLEYSPRIRLLVSSAFGSLIVYVTLLISPDVPQSLYWWTGMSAYILPLVIFTLYLVIYTGIRNNGKNNRVIMWATLSFSIIFIVGGFSETFTPVLFIFFFGAVTLGLFIKKLNPPNRAFFFFLGGMLGAITSLIVIVAAPGNANRQAFYKPPPSFFGIWNISISAFLAFIAKILFTPEKIIGIFGIFLASIWFSSIADYKNKTKLWIPPTTLLAGIALTFGCFLPAAWGLSDAPPDRNLIIPCFILVATLLLTGFTSGELLSYRLTQRWLNFTQTGLLVITLACTGFSTWVNIHNLYITRRAYIEYAQKWNTVNQQIIQAKSAGSKVVHIPAMDSWTTLDKPNDNPKFWLNICYSKYYGVQILSP